MVSTRAPNAYYIKYTNDWLKDVTITPRTLLFMVFHDWNHYLIEM